jgi:thioester reductase-like protein
MSERGNNGPAPSGDGDHRLEEELIERGGRGGQGVADLLAWFRAADAPATAAAEQRAAGWDVDRLASAKPAPGRLASAKRAAGWDVDRLASAKRAPGWDVDRLASAIASAARELLSDTVAFDAETDFFDAGGTSVAAVELVAALARDLDVPLTLDDVFADARPRRLAQLWLGATQTGTRPVPSLTAAGPPEAPGDDDLSAIMSDLARADRLPFVGDPQRLAPRRILLTGATGFLGSHLLLDLLRRSDTHVVCLVRGGDDRDAERRLGDALRSFDVPWSGEVRRRVTVLAGDIRQPRLGLTDEMWETLAADVDSIVSVAAAVDFLRGYRSLRQTNVLGPLTLAELATTNRIKPLHHVSSIAVFNEIGIASMGEDNRVAHIDRLAAGYDKSKWAAEAALRRAREHGLTVTLLRPGGIGGHTRTGAYNARDLSCGFTSAFARYRTVPAFRFLNVAAVDWVSRVAAAIVCEPSGWGQNYNLVGRPNTLPELVRDMERSGMNVEVLGWAEWRADFLARMAADPLPELDFLVRVLRHPAALKLCEATLLGPAATGERTEAFVTRHDLPQPARYDARAQLKFYERLAGDGMVRLPSRDDPPYLWFEETMKGTLGGARCKLSLTLSIASMYQLVQKRTIDVSGRVRCARLHDKPLTVETGEIWVRPDEGVPHQHGMRHPLLRYRLTLRDRDGRGWWLEGFKTARPRRDYWRQARTLAIEVGREGEPASMTGVVTVPAKSYVPDQIDGIQVNPALSSREQRLAKLSWLTWFGLQMGQGLFEPTLRAGAELLDLRRDAIDRGRLS